MSVTNSINTSLIYLSLKYVNKNYRFICKASKWINFELTKYKISNEKFSKSLDKKDFEIIDKLIKFDKTIIFKFFIKNCNVKKTLNSHNSLTHRIHDGYYYIGDLSVRNSGLVYINYKNIKPNVISYFTNY